MLRLSSLSAWIKIGWYEQKESVGTYLLPVPRFEAFALPSTVNEQRRSPRRYDTTSPYGTSIVTRANEG